MLRMSYDLVHIVNYTTELFSARRKRKKKKINDLCLLSFECMKNGTFAS